MMRDRFRTPDLFLGLLAALMLALLGTSCQRERAVRLQALDEEGYLSWLMSSLSLPDSLQYSRDFYLRQVRMTLETRQMMDWDIPEAVFRHFVLPLRVNNEQLDEFRTVWAPELRSRVRGLTMTQAALEVNHWCHEMATYRASDARTSPPLATVQRGVGRCGEESTLAVAALRAAGLPARQVYTPRWAHTDDNHAWVEVYCDGAWHFMGASEPEAVLDRAWFNAPVSRAMLLHTRVFGDYRGGEEVLSRAPGYTEINLIGNYVPHRRTSVTVLKDGQPVRDAQVRFTVYNYAQFYPVAVRLTDASGRCSLETGLGDMLVWAWKDGRLGLAVARDGETLVRLDHSVESALSMDLDVVPPQEHALPSTATPELDSLNRLRLEREDSLRLSRGHSNPAYEGWAERMPQIRDLLSEKDRTDVTPEVLEDAFQDAGPLQSPRIGHEHLVPYFREIRQSGLGAMIQSPRQAEAWVRDSIRLVRDRNPWNLTISPVYVWRSRMADAAARDMFFVALCRALGFQARLNPVTWHPEYLEQGTWKEALGAREEDSAPARGVLELVYSGGAVDRPMYYKHFTISRMEADGALRLLEFGTDADETSWREVSHSALEAGSYLLTTGLRMADGSVRAHLEAFRIEPGDTARVALGLQSDGGGVTVVGSLDAEGLFRPQGQAPAVSLLSAAGRGYFLLAILGGADEPTQHCLSELRLAAPLLNAWGRTSVILSSGDPVPLGLEHAVYGTDAGGIRPDLEKGMGLDASILPLVAVVDSFGRVVYFSQGYSTTLLMDLQRVIPRL